MRKDEVEHVAATAPWLWAFAYPLTGRGLVPLRRLALLLWAYLARVRARRLYR